MNQILVVKKNEMKKKSNEQKKTETNGIAHINSKKKNIRIVKNGMKSKDCSTLFFFARILIVLC